MRTIKNLFLNYCNLTHVIYLLILLPIFFTIDNFSLRFDSFYFNKFYFPSLPISLFILFILFIFNHKINFFINPLSILFTFLAFFGYFFSGDLFIIKFVIYLLIFFIAHDIFKSFSFQFSNLNFLFY